MTERTIETAEFVRLVTASQQALLGYAYAMVGNWTDAEDVLQEANVRLWEQQERYDPDKPFLPWARAIVYYMAMAQRSQTRRQRMRLADDVLESLAATSEGMDERLQRRRQALNRCVDKLPEKNRKLLRMCYFGGLSMKDVAAKMGRSEAAVYKSVSRIRKQLQQCIVARLADGRV